MAEETTVRSQTEWPTACGRCWCRAAVRGEVEAAYVDRMEELEQRFED